MGSNSSKTSKPNNKKRKTKKQEESTPNEPSTKPQKIRSRKNSSSNIGHTNKKVEQTKSAGKVEEQKTSKKVDDEKLAETVSDIIVEKLSKAKVSKEDFELLKVIGRGSFGKVMQVQKKGTQDVYAMKVMRKDAIIQKNQVVHTKDEKQILQKIDHPFIVKLHYAFQTETKLYMVLDYVNGGELFFHLKREGKFSIERVKLYAAEIASAISHLHSLGIVYRDLKPENILLDREGHICITDFGLSKEIAQTNDGTNTFCGTPEYLAPEVLKCKGHGYPVDWWSLGTLIYEMLTGLPPFYNKNTHLMYKRILNAPLTFPCSIPEEAKNLLEGLLDRNPEKRFGGNEVISHPFFSELNWDKLSKKEITPPWVPSVSHAITDTSQIDETFTKEEVIDSYVERSGLQAEDGVFDGFTFAGESNLPN